MKLRAVRKLKQKIIYQQFAFYWSARRLSKAFATFGTRLSIQMSQLSIQMSQVWSGNVKGETNE